VPSAERRVPITDVVSISLQIATALDAAHAAGIVHRDIKPANVFLQRTPQGERVKVLDFGIAKMADEDARAGSLTVAGGILGTPVYMAPERFRGEAIDGASDVYSVGVMLYQMLTGQVPFRAPDADLMAIVMMHLHRQPPPLAEADPEIAPEIDRIVLSALRKDPRQRPAVAALAASFARAAGRDDVADADRGAARPAGDVTPEGEATLAPADPATQHMVRPRPGLGATGKKRGRGK